MNCRKLVDVFARTSDQLEKYRTTMSERIIGMEVLQVNQIFRKRFLAIR